ncbi:MAG: GTP-binding protein [Promethearchaeota archaeon]|nr:MAG: GTP-binding protein [Candidatus Lokiarchaeota archaeon]
MSLKFKLCVFGDGGVGKTTLVNRYLTGLFKSEYKVTIGADFFMKKLNYAQKQITLQIWDFAGEDKFRFLLPRYVEGSNGAIFMYDITRHSSIVNIYEWLNVFKEGFDKKEIDIPLIMVGGKLDLNLKRTVSTDLAIELARKNNIDDVIECSSKNGENVEEIFIKISQMMIDKLELT